MIERIYIENYRCFDKCEIRLGNIALLLGENGAGKSSVFDVVRSIRDFTARPIAVGNAFPRDTRSRFGLSLEQAFEIDLRLPEGLFQYSLRVGHPVDGSVTHVLREYLTLDNKPLAKIEHETLWASTDGISPLVPLGPQGPKLSSVLSYGFGMNYQFHLRFLFAMTQIIFLRPDPRRMMDHSEKGTDELDESGENFAAWHRWLLEFASRPPNDLYQQLSIVIDGFSSLQPEGSPTGTQNLHAWIAGKGFKLTELSDGQRQLILLYSLLYSMDNQDWIFFLDEPDNYLSLREIQPWLHALFDLTGESLAQAIIISHNPEIIDQLAIEKGVWFERKNAGPTQVSNKPPAGNGPLRPSELIARGWQS